MSTFMAWMNELNGFVWGPPMLVLILGTGLVPAAAPRSGMPILRIGTGLQMVWRAAAG